MTENALKPTPALAHDVQGTVSQRGVKQKLNRKGNASRKGAVAKVDRDAPAEEHRRLPVKQIMNSHVHGNSGRTPQARFDSGCDSGGGAWCIARSGKLSEFESHAPAVLNIGMSA